MFYRLARRATTLRPHVAQKAAEALCTAATTVTVATERDTVHSRGNFGKLFLPERDRIVTKHAPGAAHSLRISANSAR